MQIGESLYVVSRDEWRAWLAQHHARKQEVWLVSCRKGSGKASLAYNEAVEEAICYGWIDSQIRSLDEIRFARRFTPRHEGSAWSKPNQQRALKMLREGQMTEAGKASLPDEVWRSRQADG